MRSTQVPVINCLSTGSASSPGPALLNGREADPGVADVSPSTILTLGSRSSAR